MCGLDIGEEGSVAEADLLAAPVCATGSGLEGPGPDELYSAGGGTHDAYLTAGDGVVEFREK